MLILTVKNLKKKCFVLLYFFVGNKAFISLNDTFLAYNITTDKKNESRQIFFFFMLNSERNEMKNHNLCR